MNENKVSLWLIVIVLIIIAGALGLYAYALKTKPVLMDMSIDTSTKQFVATGKRLGSAEVWLIPTGTGITESDYSKLTDLQNKDSGEQWIGSIPTQPFLATEVFVKAYDKNGREVGRKSYPYSGATEIYNAFNQFWLQE